MILQKEIASIAEQKGVPKTTIDKDWFLGHLLDAIYSFQICKDLFVFKGGTCLKKCYFPDYRFSEDLDFTSLDPDFRLERRLINDITALVNERVEVPLYVQQLSDLKHGDKLTGYSVIIKFWGADHSRNQIPPNPQRWQSSVKVEIILYEEMAFSSKKRAVHHVYSDRLTKSADFVPCYTISEVMAEKLRSLIQRPYTAPRDYYDIWYLSQNVKNLNWGEIIDAFYKKLKFKGLEFKGWDQIINDKNDKLLQAAWKNSLEHQIPGGHIPNYIEIKGVIKELLNEKFSK